MTQENIPWEIRRYQLEFLNGSRDEAVKMAQKYIAQHVQELMPILGGKTRDQLVKLMDQYRAADMQANCIVLDMWLQAGYDGKRLVEGFMLAPPQPPSSVIDQTAFGLDYIDVLRNQGEHEEAAEAAKLVVRAHREGLEKILSGYSLEELVALVDRYRAEGKKADRQLVEAWIGAEYPPQNITAQFRSGLPLSRDVRP